jgi:hypothetical protein
MAAMRTVCSLWQGKDHLLGIDSMGGYTEDYKRFYYRDIQAIVIRKTHWFTSGSVIFGTLAGVPSLLGLAVDDLAWRIFWLCLAGLCWLLFAVHWLRGATCVCHIRTAVQTEQLPSLQRLRTARKVLDRLRPLVGQAQGTVSAERLLAPVPAPGASRSGPSGSGVAASEPAPVSAPGARTAPPQLAAGHGRLHLLLCALLLADGARIGVDFFVDNLWIAAGEIVLWCSISLSLIMALIRQAQGGVAVGVRRWAWCVFAYVVSGFGIGYVQFILIALRHGAENGPLSEFETLRIYSQQSPFDSPWLLGAMVFALVCSLGLGTAGLILLQRAGRPTRTLPPPARPS